MPDEHNGSEKDNGGARVSDRDVVGKIARAVIGSLGTIVLVIYPIGLVTFSIQLWRNYSLDLPMALYAASTAPTALVAGKVLHVFLWSIVVTVATLLIVSRSTLLMVAIFGNVVTLGLLVIAFFIPVLEEEGGLWLAFKVTLAYFRNLYWWDLPFIILIVLFPIALGLAGPALARIGPDSDASSRWWVRFEGLVLAYVGGGVIAAMLIAGLPRYSLPCVEIMSTEQTNESQPEELSEVSGSLLAHTGGYWHLYNSSGVLVIMPEDRVKEATVSASPDYLQRAEEGDYELSPGCI